MKKFLLSVVAIVIMLTANSGICSAENFSTEVLRLVNMERAKVNAPPLRLAGDL